MQIDRRSQAGLNAVIGGALVVALASLAWLILSNPKIEPLTPPDVDPHLQDAQRFGLLAEQAGNHEEAVRQYREAFNRKPDRGDLKLNLARNLAVLGKNEEAWGLYREVITDSWLKLRPKGAKDALAWYADLSYRLGHSAEGDRLVATIIPRTTDQSLPRPKALALAHFFGAYDACQLQLSGWDHASRAAELDPKSTLYRIGLCKLYAESGKKAEAEKQYLEARRVAENGTSQDWLILNRYDDNLGHQSKAIADIEEAEKRISTHDTKGWIGLYRLISSPYGSNLGRPGRQAEVLKKIEQSVRPNDAESILTFGEFQLGQNEKQSAVALAEAALRLTSPKETMRFGRIALLFVRLGNRNRASSMLEEALPYTSSVDRLWISELRIELSRPAYRTGSSENRSVQTFSTWLSSELQHISGQ